MKNRPKIACVWKNLCIFVTLLEDPMSQRLTAILEQQQIEF